MDLILTPTCDTTLVIYPYKNANLGKFLSGINNSDECSKQKINVVSYKVLIEKRFHVILVVLKDIKKDDILYYDYNSSYNLYETSDFI